MAAEVKAAEEARAAKKAAGGGGGEGNIEEMTIPEFIAVVAKEWNKPVARLEQYQQKFEDEMIDTVKDLIELSYNESNWNEVCSSFPMGVKNRIKMKL